MSICTNQMTAKCACAREAGPLVTSTHLLRPANPPVAGAPYVTIALWAMGETSVRRVTSDITASRLTHP
jgi:hypothetical protein